MQHEVVFVPINVNNRLFQFLIHLEFRGARIQTREYSTKVVKRFSLFDHFFSGFFSPVYFACIINTVFPSRARRSTPQSSAPSTRHASKSSSVSGISPGLRDRITTSA